LFLEFREEGMSLPEIGRFFKRDHTTVCHGIKVARERRNGLGNTGELRQAVKAAEAASAIRAADPDD
jgi:chromosomal replication initiation ATPase DnaA